MDSLAYKIVSTEAGGKPNGRYAQAVLLPNGLVQLAGMFGDLPEDGTFPPGGAAEQTEQLAKNVLAVLKAAGSDASKAYQRRMFLLDIKDLPAVNEAWNKYFPPGTQASTAIQISALAKPGALLEIEVMAFV